jgi:hypothetical protein
MGLTPLPENPVLAAIAEQVDNTLVYRTIADIPRASDKAKRDAGVIPVVAPTGREVTAG